MYVEKRFCRQVFYGFFGVILINFALLVGLWMRGDADSMLFYSSSTVICVLPVCMMRVKSFFIGRLLFVCLGGYMSTSRFLSKGFSLHRSGPLHTVDLYLFGWEMFIAFFAVIAVLADQRAGGFDEHR